MLLSRHAETRCQQRGIPLRQVELILLHGTARPKPGGALEFSIPRRIKRLIQRELRRVLRDLDSIDKKAVIVLDGDVVTVYHKK